MNLLKVLVGVEIPVASAILTLCYPEQYSVIDVKNWRQIYNDQKRKTNYTPKEYYQYLLIMRENAVKYDVTPQQIDIAIWQKDTLEKSLSNFEDKIKPKNNVQL